MRMQKWCKSDTPCIMFNIQGDHICANSVSADQVKELAIFTHLRHFLCQLVNSSVKNKKLFHLICGCRNGANLILPCMSPSLTSRDRYLRFYGPLLKSKFNQLVTLGFLVVIWDNFVTFLIKYMKTCVRLDYVAQKVIISNYKVKNLPGK